MKRTTRLLAVLLASIVTFSLVLGGCSKTDTITIGSKDFSENIVLGEIFSQMIENHTDLKVNRKLNMGGTFVAFNALKNDQIDIYPEYTGTGLTAHLKMDVINDPDESYRVVSEEFDKQFSISWLEPLGLNNTYTLAVPQEVAKQYGLKTYSDLAEISDQLIFGAEHEFFDRQDGYDGLVAQYDMHFKGEPKKMNYALKYQAIGSGDMDVTDAFATDGPIKQYNLVVLEDDKHFFPPYYAAPIIRNEVIEEHPEVKEVLNMLAGRIDDATMTDLNYKVDVNGEDVATVATKWLQSQNLLQ